MRRNSGYDYREIVDGSAAGISVLDHLASTYPHSTREEWSARIQAGEVSLGGCAARAEHVLSAGDLLVWSRPAWLEPDAPRDFAVIHRDDDLLAVAKPSGLPTVPGGGFLENTLLALVRRAYPEAAPLHRLGRFTSGLVLFSRSSQAASTVLAGWHESTRKVYRALIRGVPQSEDFEIDQPIGPVPHRILGSVYAASTAGKKARSRVRLVEVRGEESLVEVEIFTGRPHQIRIHMAAAGHPLVGDPLYPAGGVPRPDARALPGDPGYALHSFRLALSHPGCGRPLELGCTPPPSLRDGGEGAEVCFPLTQGRPGGTFSPS